LIVVFPQASLEIKRLFVRYVSHEIRTPLNTTLLGLNLLETDIKEGVTDTAVLTELISDATSSCTIAIGILNDLLMYEKIDGGLLTLERAETPVWEFVEGVLKVFLIQVRTLLAPRMIADLWTCLASCAEPALIVLYHL
jgi:signal transduction histidine kinase